MPSMKATGRKTATIVAVVARTASPISLVPSKAARWCDLPMCRCRVMFSRTTIASSTRMPIDSVRDSRLSMFSVKPRKSMTASVPIIEIGSVRAVMTVLRHEFRNKNTMATAKAAPSIKVDLTSVSDSTIGFDASLTISSPTPWPANSSRS